MLATCLGSLSGWGQRSRRVGLSRGWVRVRPGRLWSQPPVLRYPGMYRSGSGPVVVRVYRGPMSMPVSRACPALPRVTPEQVAADPLLREAARVLSDLHLSDDGYLTRWIEDNVDHQPIERREFVADLIDADHVLDWRERWCELLAGAPVREGFDEPEPWLIDRPWRTADAGLPKQQPSSTSAVVP